MEDDPDDNKFNIKEEELIVISISNYCSKKDIPLQNFNYLCFLIGIFK